MTRNEAMYRCGRVGLDGSMRRPLWSDFADESKAVRERERERELAMLRPGVALGCQCGGNRIRLLLKTMFKLSQSVYSVFGCSAATRGVSASPTPVTVATALWGDADWKIRR